MKVVNHDWTPAQFVSCYEMDFPVLLIGEGCAVPNVNIQAMDIAQLIAGIEMIKGIKPLDNIFIVKSDEQQESGIFMQRRNRKWIVTLRTDPSGVPDSCEFTIN